MTPETTPPATLEGADLVALRQFLAHQPAPMAWPDFVAEIDPSFRACTRDYYKRFLNACAALEALGVATTFDLTAPLIVRFIGGRPPGQSPWTLWGQLLMLRTICSHAARNRRLIASPFATVPINRIIRLGKPRGKRHLTMAECRRLMEVLRGDIAGKRHWGQWKGRRLYAMVAIGLYTGLRKMELLRLEVDDLDMPARLIRLTPHTPTGLLKTAGSEQPVPIAPPLVPIILDWLSHRLDAPRGFEIPAEVPWLIPTWNRKGPWVGGNGPSKPLAQLKAVAARAGIEYVTIQMLRRSTATHLEAIGVEGGMISRILRHSGQQVTETFYRRADEDNIRAAVEGLSFE